jgi:hypothetical protein
VTYRSRKEVEANMIRLRQLLAIGPVALDVRIVVVMRTGICDERNHSDTQAACKHFLNEHEGQFLIGAWRKHVQVIRREDSVDKGKWPEITRRTPSREYMRSCLGASPPAIDADMPEHILYFNIHLKIQP